MIKFSFHLLQFTYFYLHPGVWSVPVPYLSVMNTLNLSFYPCDFYGRHRVLLDQDSLYCAWLCASECWCWETRHTVRRVIQFWHQCISKSWLTVGESVCFPKIKDPEKHLSTRIFHVYIVHRPSLNACLLQCFLMFFTKVTFHMWDGDGARRDLLWIL